MVVSAAGSIYLSWVKKNDSAESVLQFAKRHEGKWLAVQEISRGKDWFVNWADFPALAVNGDDKIIASWLAKSGSSTYAYDVTLALSTDDGQSWAKSFTPHDDGTPTQHGFVSLLPLTENRFAAIWLDGRETASDDGAMTLRYATINPDGSLTEEAILDDRVCDCCQTSATLTEDGLLVAYRDRSAEEVRDIAVVRLREGIWSKPEIAHADNWLIAGCPVNGPALASRGPLTAICWFTQATKDSAQVSLSFARNGSSEFEAPVRINDGPTIGRVDVVFVSDSLALIAWMETKEKEALVLVRLVGSDGWTSPAVVVARTAASRSSGFPRLAVGVDETIIAWTEIANDSARVRSARLSLIEP